MLLMNQITCLLAYYRYCQKSLRKWCTNSFTNTCAIKRISLQLYWNHTSTWVFSYKFAAYFQKTFSKEHLWTAALNYLNDLLCHFSKTHLTQHALFRLIQSWKKEIDTPFKGSWTLSWWPFNSETWSIWSW